jgi:hypothetical protein
MSGGTRYRSSAQRSTPARTGGAEASAMIRLVALLLTVLTGFGGLVYEVT